MTHIRDIQLPRSVDNMEYHPKEDVLWAGTKVNDASIFWGDPTIKGSEVIFGNMVVPAKGEPIHSGAMKAPLAPGEAPEIKVVHHGSKLGMASTAVKLGDKILIGSAWQTD